ncbi:hypothetical protein P7K49_014006 [Saguinus oedipus]|uniref:Uncharacterized protein n=1 Tax=Saguinus oedipus TaxID=9490 RepID=A0ABQ9VHQ0_SAGOE|nr:hypothetical protein P7K49_014006 [Saguinus oedipus]
MSLLESEDAVKGGIACFTMLASTGERRLPTSVTTLNTGCCSHLQQSPSLASAKNRQKGDISQQEARAGSGADPPALLVWGQVESHSEEEQSKGHYTVDNRQNQSEEEKERDVNVLNKGDEVRRAKWNQARAKRQVKMGQRFKVKRGVSKKKPTEGTLTTVAVLFLLLAPPSCV